MAKRGSFLFPDNEIGCMFAVVYFVVGISISGFIYWYRYEDVHNPEDINKTVQYSTRSLTAFLVGVAIIGSILLCSLLVQLLVSRWRRIRVFVSYQHDAEALAASVADALD